MMQMSKSFLGLMSAFGLFAACGSNVDSPREKLEERTPGELEGSGAKFSVSARALRSCDSCPEWTPDPSLSYATPSALHDGLLTVELMRSDADANPHVLVHHDDPIDLDFVEGATLAAVVWIGPEDDSHPVTPRGQDSP